MSTTELPAPQKPRIPRGLSQSQRFWERLIEGSLFSCGFLSIVITVAIACVVVYGSYRFFTVADQRNAQGGLIGLRDLSLVETWNRLVEFFTSTDWNPNHANPGYGILPLVAGTMMVALIAAAISLPIGVCTAIYLSEYAHGRVRAVAKPTLELLAGIPTVVYGYFAMTVITPGLGNALDGLRWLLTDGRWGLAAWLGNPSWLVDLTRFAADFIPILQRPYNQLSGGIVVGIMIIPLVASLSEDALRAVPRSLRDASYALGANQFQTSTGVVLPAALSGVMASFILAISRAVGETMAVSLACGGLSKFSLNPLEGVATMTGFIVNVAKGDSPADTTVFYSLFAVAAVLFFMTFALNVLAQIILRRYRTVYQ